MSWADNNQALAARHDQDDFVHYTITFFHLYTNSKTRGADRASCAISHWCSERQMVHDHLAAASSQTPKQHEEQGRNHGCKVHISQHQQRQRRMTHRETVVSTI